MTIDYWEYNYMEGDFRVLERCTKIGVMTRDGWFDEWEVWRRDTTKSIWEQLDVSYFEWRAHDPSFVPITTRIFERKEFPTFAGYLEYIRNRKKPRRKILSHKIGDQCEDGVLQEMIIGGA